MVVQLELPWLPWLRVPCGILDLETWHILYIQNAHPNPMHQTPFSSIVAVQV